MTPPANNAADLMRIQTLLREGVAHHQKGQVAEAWRIYQEVLKIQPENFHALHGTGIIAAQAKRYEEAVELIGRAVKIDPKNADAHFNHGNALRDLKRHKDAVASFDKAIRLKHDFAEAHNNRGMALRELKNLEMAVASYNKAVQFKPDFVHAYNNRGNALKDLNDLPGAVASFDKAIALKPDYADAYYNRGLAQHALKDYFPALESFDKAVRLRGDHAEAFHARGQTLAELRQFQAALDHYAKAIRIRNDYAEAYNSRGLALRELQNYDAALVAFATAVGLKADFAEAYNNRANLLIEMKRHAAAIEDYDRLIALNPGYAAPYGARLHAKMQICDWRAHDQDLAVLLDKVAQGERAAAPFAMLTFADVPALHRKAAETWTREVYPRDTVLGPIAKRPRGEKIRIGYFSMDFRQHPVAQLVVGLIEAHNRDRFEIHGFSYGPDTKDAMRERLAGAFDNFVDVSSIADKDVVDLARRAEIDIAVDLTGYTGTARTGIFATQAAPIQVNYLGYPGTMGAAYYDYMIADPIVIPPASRSYCAEKIVYLPRCYQPNDMSRVVEERVFSRDELGLPQNGFVFCCFNNNFKITPDVFDIWMRILKRVDGSVLWLLEDNTTASANLRSEAERRGVAPERLIFAARATQGEHLARHSAADLFLDTLPYNAHTTASDALWAGLPLLTCQGQSFAGRVAASILGAIDLPELVTASPEAYETRAVELATQPGLLAGIKRRLGINRTTAPLFNAREYAGHIGSAYAQMFERYHAGQPPDDIQIAS
jgi:protein O-GlcNAc transferase